MQRVVSLCMKRSGHRDVPRAFKRLERDAYTLFGAHEMEAESERNNDASIAPTLHTYSGVMKACAAGQQWRTAEQSAATIRTSMHLTLPPPPHHLAPYASHYRRLIPRCGSPAHAFDTRPRGCP